MQWTSLLGSLSIKGREDLGRQWQGRYFFLEDTGVSGEGRLQRIEEEVKITEKKAQEGRGTAELATQPWKGVVKGRDRQQNIERFEGEEKLKDSYL